MSSDGTQLVRDDRSGAVAGAALQTAASTPQAALAVQTTPCPTTVQSEPAPVSEARAEERRRILVIDDESEAREQLQSWLGEDHDVTAVDSGLQAISEVTANPPHLIDAAVRNDAAPRTVPASRALATQYLLLYEMSDDHRHYIAAAQTHLHPGVRINSRNSTDVERIRAKIDEFAGRRSDQLSVEILGNWFLFSRAMDAITAGMVNGLTTALLLITGVLAVALRSPRPAIVALAPNLLPLVIVGGTMGWPGVPLSF